MKKITLLFLFQITLVFYTLGQIDISDARGMAIGSTVTIEGIVTNGDELGIIRYIQDNTGGLPAFPGNDNPATAATFPNDVQRGDLVQVTGVLKEFNNLLEIDPIESYTVISSNLSLIHI